MFLHSKTYLHIHCIFTYIHRNPLYTYIAHLHDFFSMKDGLDNKHILYLNCRYQKLFEIDIDIWYVQFFQIISKVGITLFFDKLVLKNIRCLFSIQTQFSIQIILMYLNLINIKQLNNFSLPVNHNYINNSYKCYSGLEFQDWTSIDIVQ